LIYLDYNATTPVDQRVLDTMLPYFKEKFGNAASKTHSLGWIAEAAVTKAREQVAKVIGATQHEIVFTSGATEAINTAIKGVWETYHDEQKNHIITAATEHKAVLDTCKYLETKGARVTYLPVKPTGLIDLEELKQALTPATILVSIMYVNNETGVIQPIREIAKMVRDLNRNDCFFMSDATQAVGKIKIDVENDHIDLLCMSGHKFYAPKGVGALYVRRKNPRVNLTALIHGGGHERGLRSGTLNVPCIVALGKACEIAEMEMKEDADRIVLLRDRLENEIINSFNAGEVIINGSPTNRLYNVSNLSFKTIKGDSLISKLPDIAVSAGSACTSDMPESSHVLNAMGISSEIAFSSVRFSLGKYTTKKDIDTTIAQVREKVR
jgi:cysteine desulfurase